MINFLKNTTETLLKRKIVNQNDTNQVYWAYRLYIVSL
jgi:hypothetical protein